MKFLAATPEAYQLLHEGAIALAQIEANGIKLDMNYLEGAIKEVSQQISNLENKLRQDVVFQTWKEVHKEKTNLGSLPQLAHVLFKVMDFECKHFTPKSNPDQKIPSAKEESLALVDSPFVKDYMEWRKLCDTKGKYLLGLKREQIDGIFHPDFNLHLAATFRSSSGIDKSEEKSKNTRGTNFQALPIRDPIRGKIIRRCFIARKGRCFVEIDFSGLEVKIICCYHKDPVLMNYIKDPTTDMHRDTAMELFFLKKEEVDKRTSRDWAKNRCVFPLFYGSVYFQCAPKIWEVASDPKFTLPDKTPFPHHLAKHGIKELGDVKVKAEVKPGTFVYQVKQVQDNFWNKRFTVYRDWKIKTWEDFLKTGTLSTLTGFCIQPVSGRTGILVRNDVTNHPCQGSAFHCLLKSIILIQAWLKKHKFKTKLVGQIHDSLLADVPEDELQDFITAAHWIMTCKLPKLWKWICVPLEVEAEVGEKEGGWESKKQWVCKNEVWTPKE